MKAILDLFSTDYGLFSISGIIFMISMAIWFYRFFTRKMLESERAQRRAYRGCWLRCVAKQRAAEGCQNRAADGLQLGA